MQYRFHLYFYCQNVLSELLPEDLEKAEAFLENLASHELRRYRSRTILIPNVKINFNPAQNLYIIRISICCLYRRIADPGHLRLESLNVEVEATLSLALLELFGGEQPLIVKNRDGWISR